MFLDRCPQKDVSLKLGHKNSFRIRAGIAIKEAGLKVSGIQLYLFLYQASVACSRHLRDVVLEKQFLYKTI